jgi:hypothetical protein
MQEHQVHRSPYGKCNREPEFEKARFYSDEERKERENLCASVSLWLRAVSKRLRPASVAAWMSRIASYFSTIGGSSDPSMP